ncbi:MAG TPA: hypothetical protein VME17_21720 [Bryobacteraceae bacterium]|nr:hypothetical protein [Bryobacteraceae bacterium]
MNRFSLLLLLTLGGMCLEAQTSSTITISTNPAGARFTVDGTLYSAAVTLNWPAGSEHTVVFLTDPAVAGQTNLVQTSLDGGTEYAFNGWVDNLALTQPIADPVQVITANPNITTLTAQLTVSYKVTLNYFTPSGSTVTSSPPVCGAPGAIPAGLFRPGVVYIGSTCYWSSVVLFLPANTTVTLNAYPYPGFVFTGWEMNSATPTAFLTQFTLNEAVSITPLFEPGKLVSFLTSPLGMNLLIDHTTVPTRTINDIPGCPNNETQPVVVETGFPAVCFGDFYFAPGSTHYISGVSPQMDNTGKWWVFNGWSNGDAANALYQVDSNTSTTVVLTGDFVPGAQVALLTSPTGLPLTVDGRSWPSYDFIWGLGTTHQIAAAASQTGSNGRQYTFQGWSNGGSASQTYTVDQTAVNSGMVMTANYNELNRIVVQSSPPGLTLQVDGSSCVTPCNIDRQSGATVQVTAPTQVAMGQGSRLDFGSWSDGGASTHTVTASQNYTTLTASYNTYFQLSAASNPGNGSAFKFSPNSSDMYYSQGTQVTVTAVPNTGFKFGHWTGALSGSFPSGSVQLTSPQAVVAQMITIPYIAPAGILNGVGQTPSTAVAPGSIVSIFGQNLAPGVQVGPGNPLAQTLSGVTVTVNDSILPLMFVSPQQINAQLPSSLAPGDYTLEVQNAGQSPISGNFTVARDAPGLFFQTINSVDYAMALHPDGSLVSTASPAAAGETISLLGTGFGPYQQTVLDGFFPPNPPPAVTDTVTLSVAGVNPSSTSTAAPGFVGAVQTQFQVPSGLASGTPVPVFVTIDGVNSNTVMLPVQ